MHRTLFTFLFLCFYSLVQAQTPYQVYFGNLHSHTGNSDGTGDPEDAFAYARDSAGLDFLAVTDHLEQIDPLEWYFVKDEADNVTVNGAFIGIAGWEWGSPVHGHVNVFNTSDMITDVGNLWYTTDLPAFYNWVLTHTPAFAQFNHPGDETYFTNWNDFAYTDSTLDNAFPLLEVQTIQQATDYYEHALNKGWHLSPVWNQDNHSADWGNKNNGRAGIWATALTRTALFDAMKAGRTFATMDKNASVWIDINGNDMGKTINRFPNMPLHIKLQDGNSEAWQSVQLVSSNGVLMTFTAPGNLDTIIPLTLYNDMYVFVRAVQADGDYIWSAPVYFTGVLTHADFVTTLPVEIFPNPASDVVYVGFGQSATESARITIMDINGRTVLENNSSLSGAQTLQIPLQPLSAGFYTIAVSTPHAVYYRKLVIKK